jgi:hypothetical protein
MWFLNQEKGLYVEHVVEHTQHETFLMINMHVEYGVVKSFIQLGYKVLRVTNRYLSWRISSPFAWLA